MTWQAQYIEAGVAEPRAVLLTMRADGFAFGSALWPYYQVRLTQGGRPGEPVRLERGGEALVIADRGILELLPANLKPGGQSAAPVLGALIGGGAVLAAGLIALVWLGLPPLTRALARLIPASVEERIGSLAAAQFQIKPCTDPGLERAVAALVDRLEPPAPVSVSVADDSLVNAFALPGGRIVLFRGLIAKTDSPEELAGVLAHEMQHVVQRHSMQALVRAIGLGALIQLIAGDSSTLALAGQMSSLHFSRSDEESADRGAMNAVIAAGLDPEAMVSVYRKIEAESDQLSGGMQYLSTHPAIEERIANLRGLSGQSRSPVRPIKIGDDWRKLRNACDAGR